MAEFGIDSMLDGKLGFCNITSDEVRKVVNAGGVQALEPYLQNKLNEWKTVPLNVGIIGNSGSGKSSFINAIRGLTADDVGSAATGATETTTIPTAYSHPNNDMLKFWDLPGVGTPNFPKETYLQNVGFTRFDFFVIISSDRFTENDLWLGKRITENGKKFFFARTKIHIDMLNNKEDHPKTHDRETILHKIRRNIESNLGNCFNTELIFLIDSHHRKEYQFEALEQKLIDEFPKLKQHALVMSMTALNREMVSRKVNELRSRVWLISSISGIVAAVPVPGVSTVVDISMILAQSLFFYHQLGLDEESLKKMAKVMSTDLLRLREAVKNTYSIKAFLTLQGIKDILVKVPALVISTVFQDASRFIPLIGLLVSAPISFGTTFYILSKILTQMEQVAFNVVAVAAEHSGADGSMDGTKNNVN